MAADQGQQILMPVCMLHPVPLWSKGQIFMITKNKEYLFKEKERYKIRSIHFLHWPSNAVILSTIPTSLNRFFWFSFIASGFPPLSGLNKSKSKTMLIADLKNDLQPVYLIDNDKKFFRYFPVIKQLAYSIR